MRRPKVHLTGAEGTGWALDEYQRLAREACRDFVEFTSLEDADVVHSAWWDSVAAIPAEKLHGKRVLCDLDNPPSFWLTRPRFRCASRVVSCWLAHGRQAREQCETLGFPHHFVPYRFDSAMFFPQDRRDAVVRELRARYSIPEDRYVIGNFHRDSEGADLGRAKVQKGADAFAEIVRLLHERGNPVHVLLAGPRRHFLRRKLTEYGVPWSFAGRLMDEDDLKYNILDRAELNRLYSVLDLCLVSSRWEGGPYSVMEAAASKCRIVSTPVGVALDVLEPRCIYDDVPQAVSLIEGDIREESLRATLEPQRERALRNHGPEAVKEGFRSLYAQLEKFEPFRRGNLTGGCGLEKSSLVSRANRKLSKLLGISGRTGKTVSFLASRPDPFLTALGEAFRSRGAATLNNEVHSDVDFYVASAPFERAVLDALAEQREPCVIHRMGFQSAWDDLGRELNERFATATTYASFGTLCAATRAKLTPVNPLVIAEPASRGGSETGPFVLAAGGASETDLRAVAAALARGQPVVYPRGSPTAELVALGGMAYENGCSLERAELAAANLTALQRCIQVPAMEEAVDAYLGVAR
jgi:glycosyltransferase involved in cell wall biosynthesis